VEVAVVRNIIARLNAAAVEATADQSVLGRFGDLGLEVALETPEALGALQKADIEKCGQSSRLQESRPSKAGSLMTRLKLWLSPWQLNTDSNRR
jgi:hypothetical protein